MMWQLLPFKATNSHTHLYRSMGRQRKAYCDKTPVENDCCTHSQRELGGPCYVPLVQKTYVPTADVKRICRNTRYPLAVRIMHMCAMQWEGYVFEGVVRTFQQGAIQRGRLHRVLLVPTAACNSRSEEIYAAL